MTLLHIDLCCGLGGWQQPFEADPQWQSVGIDVRDDLAADVVGDVRQLPLTACEPTLVTASPPCTEYSTAWNRWKPLPERDPDRSVWRGCLNAVDELEPEWCILENVGGAQHFWGDADKTVYPWFFWGDFPPFDVGSLPRKGSGKDDMQTADIVDPEEAARIPEPIARAVKQSVEVYS